MTRVSIVRVDGRTRERVTAAVRRAVNMAGGLTDLIHPGMLVMVKTESGGSATIRRCGGLHQPPRVPGGS